MKSQCRAISVSHTILLLLDANLLQDVLQSDSWPSRNDIGPYFLFESFFFRQDAPVWAMFRLEPFEIINLVPVVLYRPLRGDGMTLWDRGEADITAVLNNRSTSTMKVDVDILTIMHTDLS